jgi:hypothetical protein
MSGQKARHEIKILSIGGAVQDVFLIGKIFAPKHEHHETVEEFVMGSKNQLDGVIFSTGGGATNASVTFARQGFHSMYMGKIGHDIAGKAILDDLHSNGVDTSLVGYSKDMGSGYSAVLLAPNGERTIMSYRGASAHYDLQESDFHNLEADWFYVTSLDGNFEVLDEVFAFASKKGIKIAMNPGAKELADKTNLRRLIPQTTLLSMNKDEMQQIYEGKTMEELVRAAKKDVPYVIVTDGPHGAVAADMHHIISAGMYEDVPVVDRTGAGDAFSSGFTAMIAANESLEKAVTLASANSTSVVGSIGAKVGILYDSAKLHKMEVSIKDF